MDAVSPDTMAAYMNRHSKDLAVETNYFGGWLDRKSGEVYLDISKNVQDLEEAKKLGKDWEQLAIFDLSSMEEIRLAREQAREVVYLPKDDPEAAYEELRKLIDDEE